MTKDRDFKDNVRARAASTGEPYTEARERLLEQDPGSTSPRRVIGVETRYRLRSDLRGERRLTEQEAMRFLFRRVVSWGRSSNVFLTNGARLYMASGPLAEYATPECSSPAEVVAHTLAGDEVLRDLTGAAVDRLREEGIRGSLDVRTARSATGGSHESYLARRRLTGDELTATLVPHLVSRQLLCGTGAVLRTEGGAMFALSARAEHIQAALGAPQGEIGALIDIAAAPFADEERFSRVHVVGAEANHRPAATFVRVGTTDLVVRMLDERPDLAPRVALESPGRAMREVSHDVTGKRRVKLASGGEASALDLQRLYLVAVERFLREEPQGSDDRRVVLRWGELLDAVESDDPVRLAALDWPMKLAALRAEGIALSDSRSDEIDATCESLAQPIDPSPIITPSDVASAKTTAPPTTRASLRGRFIALCSDRRRNYTVDWMHLKLNEAAPRTIVLKDPTSSADERVQRLLEYVAQS